MKMKFIAAAALVASGVGSAFANTYGFAMPLAPAQLPYSIGIPVFGAGWFSDDWNFTAPSGSASVSASAISVDITSFYNIDSLSVSLYQTAGNVLVASGTPGDGSTLQNIGVTGGTQYYFQVGGKVTDPPKNGFYVFSAIASPVPEPETYAMMLAGLGALGFLARRRKS